MSNLKVFLKILNKFGYPNPSLISYAKMTDYNLDDLFDNLVDEVGYEKANEFVRNAIQSMSKNGKGIRVDLDEITYPGDYVYIIIRQSRIDLDESDSYAFVSWSWGESRIKNIDEEGNEFWTTIEGMWEYADLGSVSDLTYLAEDIQGELSYKIYKNCGFRLWFANHV
jgi:hypothetical protein